MNSFSFKILFHGIILFYVILVTPASAIKTMDTEPESSRSQIKKMFGDYSQMVERRLIRVLVPPSKTFYFLDGARPRGAAYETLKQFETVINKDLSTKTLKVNIFIIPTSRDRLIPDLNEGLGDLAVGNLTITKERLKQIDFSAPFFSGVNEILVTPKDSPEIKKLEDLSGKEVHVRKSSSYFESLKKLNTKLVKRKKPRIKIIETNPYLEDEDLLEMVNAKLIPAIVMDSHKAEFWAQVFDNIRLHSRIRLRENAAIAWAMRKDSPELKKTVNTFARQHRKGTLFGNVIFNRYLKNTSYINNHYMGEDRKRFESTVRFFQKFADQYDFDWLMLAALAYQESRINQEVISHAGAVGVMQILPKTANNNPINIQDIHEIEHNIHAGTKYLRYIIDRYFSDPGIDEMNRVLLAFASYNAGPARISKLRRKTARSDLDPNVWFRNVEVLAAKHIGRETVNYVSNILKYYVAYRYILGEKLSGGKIKQDQ